MDEDDSATSDGEFYEKSESEQTFIQAWMTQVTPSKAVVTPTPEVPKVISKEQTAEKAKTEAEVAKLAIHTAKIKNELMSMSFTDA